MQALGRPLAYRGYIIRLATRGHFSPAHPDEGAQGEGCVRPCTPLAHGATKGLTKRPSVKRSISAWRHCVTAFVALSPLRRFPSQLDNLNAPCYIL